MNGYVFTERMRKILALAQDDARMRQHEFVGAEHLLLGLITEGEGVGAIVLQSIGVDLSALKVRAERDLKPADAARTTGPDLPYTAQAKKVLELAMGEAAELNHAYVGSEHLLLALLREKRSIAAQALADAGATLEAVRNETRRILGDETAPQSNALTGTIADIGIDIELADGSKIRGDFRSVAAAMHFLKHAALNPRPEEPPNKL